MSGSTVHYTSKHIGCCMCQALEGFLYLVNIQMNSGYIHILHSTAIERLWTYILIFVWCYQKMNIIFVNDVQ